MKSDLRTAHDGVKVMTFVKRPSACTVEDFQREWRAWGAERVGDLPGVVRYVQSHTLPSGYGRHDPMYDGVSELWVRGASLADPSRVEFDRGGPASRAHSVSLIVHDVLVKSGPVPANARKCFALTYKRHDLAIAAFHRHWSESHGPLAAEIPGMLLYVQCHARRLRRTAGGRLLAGCAITWWRATADLRQAMETPQYAAVLDDEPNFTDGPSPVVLTTEELVLVGPAAA